MSSLRFLDLKLPTAAENLALDEALLLAAEAGEGSEVMRLWEWPRPVVVLGAGGRWREEVDVDACLRDGVPILRRASGGGTVLLGRGCLVFTLVLRYDRAPELAQVTSSYAWILTRVVRALGLPGAAPAGTSDLAVGGRKFSGNSQQRKRDHLLHHGTLLYDFDLTAVGRYLRTPPKQPEYRQGRGHEEFLCNLDLPPEVLKHRLRQGWEATDLLLTLPVLQVQHLMTEKYSVEAWARRR
jgi:lipoate-protein ligase A